MDQCKHCGKELSHVEGRKKKAFCNANCRNKYFYAKNKKLVQEAKKAIAPSVQTSYAPQNENEFMGHLIPNDLTGIPLAVWKNNIKLGKKNK